MLGAPQLSVMGKEVLVMSWKGSGWDGHKDILKENFSARIGAFLLLAHLLTTLSLQTFPIQSGLASILPLGSHLFLAQWVTIAPSSDLVGPQNM